MAKDYEYHSVKEDFTYYHCTDCGTIFIHPVPLNQLKEIYPSNYYSFVTVSKNIVVKIKEWLDKRLFKKILSQLNSAKIDVLDVGGGTGWILDVLKKTENRIDFTQIADIDEKASIVAEQNGHAYFKGTIEEFNTDTPNTDSLDARIFEEPTGGLHSPGTGLFSQKRVLGFYCNQQD
ncbi:MAG: hypothetical protein IPQ25_19465 [Chitinophagaceae bacterium]|nr:hypothetical protein [Chitinophagaceae bacterium]